MCVDSGRKNPEWGILQFVKKLIIHSFSKYNCSEVIILACQIYNKATFIILYVAKTSPQMHLIWQWWQCLAWICFLQKVQSADVMSRNDHPCWAAVCVNRTSSSWALLVIHTHVESFRGCCDFCVLVHGQFWGLSQAGF